MKRQPIRRRSLTACLAVLVLSTAVVSPLLDAREDDRATHVEREHDPKACRSLHDHHSVCSQLARSFGRDAPITIALARPDVAERSGSLRDVGLPPLRSHTPSPSPRGPPIPLV